MNDRKGCEERYLEAHAHRAPVVLVHRAPEEPPPLATGDQRHHTVMLRLQALGQLGDRGPFTLWIPLHLQHELVLQRGQAVLADELLAVPQVAS
jgi:hypothetical protein